jgi:hypothetical protein
MLHDNIMTRFVVLSNMAYGVMENEELMVLSTNSPAHHYMTIGMGQCMNATIAKDNTLVYDTARHTAWQIIYSVM